MPATRLTGESGTYALVLKCAKTRRIKIGRLGELDLMPGYYVYAGSAFGTGGVRARLRHHLHQSPSPHWHIDYLKAHCSIREIWVQYSATRREAVWVAALSRQEDAGVPLPGFGASDTRALSHLFHFKTRPRVNLVTTPEHIEIVRLSPDSAPAQNLGRAPRRGGKGSGWARRQ